MQPGWWRKVLARNEGLAFQRCEEITKWLDKVAVAAYLRSTSGGQKKCPSSWSRATFPTGPVTGEFCSPPSSPGFDIHSTIYQMTWYTKESRGRRRAELERGAEAREAHSEVGAGLEKRKPCRCPFKRSAFQIPRRAWILEPDILFIVPSIQLVFLTRMPHFFRIDTFDVWFSKDHY
ncbi:hypothetical protein NDU88_005514 [Pleurodeles waltl]|uniref:Uncharacterized protein n=1 Tax=Pleurodeles waltl TaxID=8319 RepID=A0AAV7QEZ8_PLEWA|nr:hypothetical protein NDU88_005514 [Pleurodeles waltl]